MSRALDWLDRRTGIRELWRHVADEPVPGGARWRYVFGSVLTYLFMQQVVLGILLASTYSPSATDAWASTAYLNDQVAGGWFLRGLHHHGSSAMVVVVVLHALQVIIAGAYRAPRELNYWTGLAMGGIVLAFALTGYLLPWDQKGYWATQVATGIVGSVPFGEPLKVLLQGGAEYGNFTLTRFYALHVFVLPLGLGALLGLHLLLFRRHGVTPPVAVEAAHAREGKHPKDARFFPDQLFLDVVAMAITGAALVLLTFQTHGAELFAPAQPASSFLARPEWYFLFLFQLLKYFEGPLQIVATVIIPGAVAAYLVALPFVDRAPDRRVARRAPVLAGVAAILAGAVALTALAIVEDAANEHVAEAKAVALEEAERARALARAGVLPEGGDAVFHNDPAWATQQLFKEHCGNCHTIAKMGPGFAGREGPELTDYGSRAWIAGLVRDPNTPRYFGNTKHDDMEAYPVAELSDADLTAVVEYVASVMDDPAMAVDATLAAKGKAVFEDDKDCSICHEVTAGVSADGPNLRGHGTAAWVERVIRDSSAADLFGEAAQMPKFKDKLSDADIAALAAFVVGQRAAPAAAAEPAGG
jgi:ubiquinol-cytochrome c reductase cytochrome b subunit